MSYVSLHTHSEFSLLDGMSRVKDIVQKAIDNNVGISCITDHGNMYAVADHFAIANQNQVKPIAGFEAYVVDNHLIKSKSKTEETDVNSAREHFILLAKDQIGYEAISKMCSIGAMEGFYYKPRIDDKIMEQAINDIGDNHIIASSACFVQNTQVLTYKCFKNIQDLTTQDKVFTHNKQWQKVTSVFNMPYNDVLYTFKVKGCSVPITCTKDHKFYVKTKNGYTWKEAQKLKLDDVLLTTVDTDCNDINLPEQLLQFIGIYLAIGCLKNNQVVLKTDQLHIQEHITKTFNNVFHCEWEGKYLIINKDVVDSFAVENFGYILYNYILHLSPAQQKVIYKEYLNITDEYNPYIVYMQLRNNMIPYVEDYKQKGYRCCMYDEKQNYIEMPITEITVSHKETTVYCITVDKDASFIANNIIVHNCIAGRIPRYIIKGDMDNAIKWTKYYANLFKDNFYLELQPTMDEQQVIVNKGLIDIADKLGLPLIATTDSHYTNKEDSKAHELLLCLQTKTTWDNPKRWKFQGDTFWIMNEKQITKAFTENGHQVLNQDKIKEAIQNTELLAKQCNVTLERGKYYLPDFQIPKNEEFEKEYPNQTALDYLKYQCKKGLKEKIKDFDAETKQKYKERLKYELGVIESMHFETYFLVVQDYIQFANEHKIPTGPGRGCFTKDNKVHTLNGTKNIKDITLNDKVLSRDGKYHTVIDILKYHANEILNHISVDDKQIRCTKDHKILGIKEQDYINGDRTPHWYSSNDLQVGDYVCSL